MPHYFIPHKLKVGDITNLSDKDSEFIIQKKLFNIEDPIQIKNLSEVFWGVVTHMDKTSVEVEIIEKISDIKPENNEFEIIVIQSITNDARFNFFLEKMVELGVKKIIPVESKYSLITKNKAIKKFGMWKKVLSEAREQSRNTFEIEIEKPMYLRELKDINMGHKLCFTTENEKINSLGNILKQKDIKSKYIIAIGPERGWSISDLEIFKNLGFEFVKLEGNILRTETAAIVVASILNFRAGKF